MPCSEFSFVTELKNYFVQITKTCHHYANMSTKNVPLSRVELKHENL